MKADFGAISAKSARGVGWGVAWRVATRVMGLGSTLVLVRMLSPSDFGLVAVATGLSNAVEQFGWVGVEAAIVRDADPDRSVYDTGFTINLVRSVLLGCVIAALAGPAARFFGESRLEPVLFWLAAASACMGLENVGVVEFRRSFAFDLEFRYLLVPRVCSIVLAITAALVFRSYWALVVGIVSGRVLRVAASYWMHPFRPRASFAAWRRLAGTSMWMWLLGIASLLRDRGDTLVLGRMMSSAAVGLYSIGFDFAALTFTEIVEALQRPAFSGFVAARNAGVPVSGPLLGLLGTIGLVSIPAGIGMSAVAGPVIALVAGSRWSEAVPVMQILASAGVVVVLGAVCRTMLTATGRFRMTASITVVVGVVRIAALLVAIPLAGLRGAAWAAGATMALEGMIFVVAAVRSERISWRALLARVWRPGLATGVMAGALGFSGLGWAGLPAQPAVALAAGAGGGALVYASVLFGLWAMCGRQAGAEADALRLVSRSVRRRR